MANMTKAQLQKAFDELKKENTKLQAKLDSHTSVDVSSYEKDISNLRAELDSANVKIAELSQANQAGMTAYAKLESKLKEYEEASQPATPRKAVLVNAH